MSDGGKGSKRRPGTGYAENWERVFWKKPAQHQFGDTMSKADRWMLETRAAEIAGRMIGPEEKTLLLFNLYSGFHSLTNERDRAQYCADAIRNSPETS